jgi:hypothetical protein
VILLWLAIAAGPTLWVAHLTFGSALVEYACTKSEWEWAIHGLTVATALPVVAAALYCLRLARRVPHAEDAGTLAGSVRFLALFGLLTAAISLALILLEGSYVLFIDACD